MLIFFLICLGNIKRIVILIWYDVAAGGAAAIEALKAELVHAKEQDRASNAVSLKAAEDLRAEQAAHRRSEEKIAEMAVELKTPPTVMSFLKKKIMQIKLT